jgi:hypothetical protein
MSLPQLLFGEAKTNLGEMIVLQQLLRDNFYTTVLAPIEVLPNGVSLTVKMDQITFKPILPQITPEEGTCTAALRCDTHAACQVALASLNGSSTASRRHCSARRCRPNSATSTLAFSACGTDTPHRFLYDPNGAAIARKVLDQLYNGIEEGLKFGVM